MTNDPMRIPPRGNAICQGFSHEVFVRLCCPTSEAASDGFCHFEVTSSNNSVLQILDTFHNVPANTCTPEMFLGVNGNSAGTVDLILRDTVSGARGAIGTVTVGSQPCVF